MPLKLSITVVGTAVVALAAMVAYTNTQSGSEAEARTIIAACADRESVSCYEAIANLVHRVSVPEVFTVVQTLRQLNSQYTVCHSLAHTIGEAAVRGREGEWFELMRHNPPGGLCTNGFLHGVILGRFGAEILSQQDIAESIPDFARACLPRDDWSPNPATQTICYHGLGHVYMDITGNDILKALSLCETTAVESRWNVLRACKDGVFMQVYELVDPTKVSTGDFAGPITKGNYRQYCATLHEPLSVGACLRRAWRFYEEDIVRGLEVESVCAGQPNETEEGMCYKDMAIALTRELYARRSGIAEVMQACAVFPNQWQSLCFSRAAEMTIIEDPSNIGAGLALCEGAPESSRRECFLLLSERAGYIFGDSAERYAFCLQFPKDVEDICLQAEF